MVTVMAMVMVMVTAMARKTGSPAAGTGKNQKNENNDKQITDAIMKKIYEKPSTSFTAVETESGFMGASIFEKENDHDDGLTTEEHDFADPSKTFEGDYSDSEWDL